MPLKNCVADADEFRNTVYCYIRVVQVLYLAYILNVILTLTIYGIRVVQQ